MAPDLNKKDDNTNTALDNNQLDYEQTPDTDPNCSDSKEDSSINDSDSDSDDEEVPSNTQSTTSANEVSVLSS